MRLRTQLAIAFFVLAVLPLLGVTLYTWLGSQRAFRQAVAGEAGDLAAEMSTRVDVVADELKTRLQKMAVRPAQGEERPYQKARREALAAAEGEELRLLLRAILSGAERRQGAIPFALDREGRLYAPEPADEAVLGELGVGPGNRPTRRDAGEWVVAQRNDEETGIVIGVARPVGPALQAMRRTAANNLALGLGLAALALLGILPLSRRMTRHLASLTEGAERLGAGDLDVRVPVPHGREFRHLAETFNRLARDLRQNQERLLEQERLRKELEIGRRIQEELLPRGPLLGPFAEMGGVSIPAREVGGDFFNYFALPRDEVTILIGDVSGKGVPAALLMASLQAKIHARLALERRAPIEPSVRRPSRWSACSNIHVFHSPYNMRARPEAPPDFGRHALCRSWPVAVRRARRHAAKSFTWPTKCSSTPPIPRKLGWWCFAVIAFRNSTLRLPTKSRSVAIYTLPR